MMMMMMKMKKTTVMTVQHKQQWSIWLDAM
jgi:hypothetical protein